MSTQIIQEAINQQTRITFLYEYSQPNHPRILTPVSISGNNVLCIDGDGKYKKFKIDGIKHPAHFKKWSQNECEGCKNDCPGQRDHMEIGGCLSEDIERVICKVHSWDCGHHWNYTLDKCGCGEKGWVIATTNYGNRAYFYE